LQQNDKRLAFYWIIKIKTDNNASSFSYFGFNGGNVLQISSKVLIKQNKQTFMK